MRIFLQTLFLLLLGSLFLQAQEARTLTSFGQPVSVQLKDDALVWSFLSSTDGKDAGVVDWKGARPVHLRGLSNVMLPDGNDGVAVLGYRDGRDSLFLLQAVWGGAELWGAQAWQSADIGQTIEGYQWLLPAADSAVSLIWTSESLYTRSGSAATSYLDTSVSLANPLQNQVEAYPVVENGLAAWVVVSANLTSQGWQPLVWDLKNGVLTSRAAGAVTSALQPAAVSVGFSHPESGSFALALSQGLSLVYWSWTAYGVNPPISLAFGAPLRGQSAGLPGRGAFFWWIEDAQAQGLTTASLGQSAVQPWAVTLPAQPVWSSDVFDRSGGWRVWLLIPQDSAMNLYRLDVRSDGYSSLDKAGTLPDGTTELKMAPQGTGWSVETPQNSWFLDPELPTLTPNTSAGSQHAE